MSEGTALLWCTMRWKSTFVGQNISTLTYVDEFRKGIEFDLDNLHYETVYFPVLNNAAEIKNVK